MVLVGAAAEEPPGVPVDAGHLADEVQVGMAVGKGPVHLVGQRLHGPLKGGQVLLLVGLEPALFVVEPDAPHEVHGGAGKALKHKEPSFSL